jgi:hypothetical protein
MPELAQTRSNSIQRGGLSPGNASEPKGQIATCDCTPAARRVCDEKGDVTPKPPAMTYFPSFAKYPFACNPL